MSGPEEGGAVVGAQSPGDPEPLLAARGLTKHFAVRGRRARRRNGRRAVVHAVEDVDLDLRPGRVAALVGESGSGKTTVTHLLARLVTPTGGQVLMDDEPATGRLRDYRRRVQVVFQDPFSSLNPIHDVHYHLSRPLRLYGKAGRRDVDAAVHALLRRVKLEPAEDYAHKLPHELSGGQRQRVAIARALAAGPSVLLADEPVSMLDVSVRLGVLNLIDELRSQENLAILYVTHDIASARYFADTMTVMYAGRIVEAGPSAQVTDHAAHPYTQLLIAAAPDPDRSTPAVIRSGGAIPSLVDPPKGCRFHPRCPHAMEICSVQAPPPSMVGDDHHAACWLYDGEHAK